MGKTAAISPFAPAALAVLPAIAGVRFATAEAGIRYQGRTDLLLAVFDPGTQVAGVLTQSKTRSAPVEWCAEQLKKRPREARALVVNSGNANAFTGLKGREAVRLTVEAAAKAAGCKAREVFVASTGVIGEPLGAAKFTHILDSLACAAAPDRFHDAARAIMTTDTYPKVATRRTRIGDTEVTINGICKGAGMIAPDMATMLCFMFTDAAIDGFELQAMLQSGVQSTFDCLTIDGDTSTSDTCLLFATQHAAGRGQKPILSSQDAISADFEHALHDLMRDLAIQVAKDGEGLSKFVTVEVAGADGFDGARKIALSIANSPLVKTAVAGEDPNWGRVVMAVGKAGQAADRDRLAIWFGPHLVAENGERAASYDEATLAAYMKGREIVIRVDVGVGSRSATVWTCDLTERYVAINADYRS